MNYPSMNLQNMQEALKLEWQEEAACVLWPSRWWFPEQNHGNDKFTHKAKAICATCPVQKQCLTYALASRNKYDPGIYGGLAMNERAALRVEMREAGTMIEWRICTYCDSMFEAQPNTQRQKDPEIGKRGPLCSGKCRRAKAREWDRAHRPSGSARTKARLKRES
jgi:WhiB family redox-sensing transcriptional regulator